jgi:hypothetical protein
VPQREGNVLELINDAPGQRASDFLLLIGERLDEPVVASGPWVFTDARDLARAEREYEAGMYGVPWSHTVSYHPEVPWRSHTLTINLVVACSWMTRLGKRPVLTSMKEAELVCQFVK